MSWGTTLWASPSFKIGSKDSRQGTRTGISRQRIPTTRPSWVEDREGLHSRNTGVCTSTPPPLSYLLPFIPVPVPFALEYQCFVSYMSLLLAVITLICTLHLLLIVYSFNLYCRIECIQNCITNVYVYDCHLLLYPSIAFRYRYYFH